MDIALSSVFIILGVLPGIVFWNSYLSGRFSREVFGASTVAELAWYIVLAVPINAIALRLLSDDPRILSPRTALEFLTSKSGENINQVLENLQASWWASVVAYLCLLVVTYIAGNVLRRFVWALRLDVRFPMLRMKHSWYYLLQGRLPGVPRAVFPYADILVSHPEGSRLYRGLIWRFEPTGSGEIKELVLEDAQRGKGRGAEFTWHSIPGNQFILLGPTIHSINMRYVFVAPPKGIRARVKYELKAFARSFLLQEP